MAQLVCTNPQCTVVLMYPRGANQVQCSVCGHVNDAMAVRSASKYWQSSASWPGLRLLVTCAGHLLACSWPVPGTACALCPEHTCACSSKRLS